MYGGMDVKLHVLLSSAVHVGKRSGQLDTQPKNSRYRIMVTWVGPRHCEDDRIRRIETQFLGHLVRVVDTVSTELTCLEWGYFAMKRKPVFAGAALVAQKASGQV